MEQQTEKAAPRRDTIVCAEAVEFMQTLPDHCVDSIITDPPYYRVKGDFDFQWGRREAFLADAERWATAVAAKMEGRHFLGCEIEKKYTEIAERRVSEATAGIGL